MTKSKDIRDKIASIKKTRKITNAMQMVATGKRRKAESRMKASLPYADKISKVIEHITQSSSEYLNHPYIQKRDKIKRVGFLVISTNRGLCGGLNLNLFKKVLEAISDWQRQDVNADLFLIGNKAGSFFKNLHLPIKTQVAGLGDKPLFSDLIGTVHVMCDSYASGEVDALFVAYNEFVNTMRQEPNIKQILPLTSMAKKTKKLRWDYIYEPNTSLVLETLLKRHIETQIYQAMVDNIACEQASRMVAMQSATENASKFIAELQNFYNKARQAGITREIIEVVSGAEAV